MTATHELGTPLFDGSPPAPAAPDAIEALRAAQLSKHLLLIGHLLTALAGRSGGGARRHRRRAGPRARTRCRRLRRGDRRAARRRVGVHRRPRRSGDGGRRPTSPTSAASPWSPALRPASTPAPRSRSATAWWRSGLGAASRRARPERPRLPPPVARLAIPLRSDPGRTVPRRTSPMWRRSGTSLRTSAGQPISLGLDDLDPYRHGHHAPPVARVSAGRRAAVACRFAEAWHLLAERCPGARARTRGRPAHPGAAGPDRSRLRAQRHDPARVRGLRAHPSAVGRPSSR